MLETINQPDIYKVPQDLINQLINLYHQGNYEKALKQSTKLLQQYPQAPSVLNIIGAVYSILGQPEASVHHLRKALKLQPQNPYSNHNLGAVLNDLEQYQEAQQFLERAIQIKPDYAEAHNNLGNVFQKQQQYKKASECYTKAININPQHYDAYNNLGNSQRNLGNYSEAIKNWITILDEDHGNLNANINLATLYFELGYYDFGIDITNKALNFNPGDLSLLGLLAKGFATAGRNQDAIVILRKIICSFPTSVETLLDLIKLSSFSDDIDYRSLYAKFCTEMDKLNTIQTPEKEPAEVPMVAFTGFGRSGSLFLHSLIDGHPDVSTLPGYFFKGWFGKGVWKILAPDMTKPEWKKLLAENICNHFEPQFNAKSKKNVIGKPNGNTDWLAKNLGFTTMGPNHSKTLLLDQELFKNHFLQLLQLYKSIDQKICFELIHKAFDLAYRGNDQQTSGPNNKPIFYHIHNPNIYEKAHFLYHYPKAKVLTIIRHPIQMLESWLLSLLQKANHHKIHQIDYPLLLSIKGRIINTFLFLHNPLNTMPETRGVKLEDIKRNPKKTLPAIANWIGVEDDPALYKGEFLKLQHSRPSANFDNITGFDNRSIEVPIGRFFNEKEIQILETLFWPFMKTYHYTDMPKQQFQKNMKLIRPWLEEPFQFEENAYNKICKEDGSLKYANTHEILQQHLINAWETLHNTGTYSHIIPPLQIE